MIQISFLVLVDHPYQVVDDATSATVDSGSIRSMSR